MVISVLGRRKRMKKFFEGIIKRYKDRQIRRVQHKLESDLRLILAGMIDAAEQMQIHRGGASFYYQKKFMEAAMAIELGNDTVKESLPQCSSEFRMEALARIKVVERLLIAMTERPL